MANKQGEFQLKVASSKPNKFNMDKKVVATHDFGTLTPIECKLMLPGDKFDVNVNQFTYLMPMPKPTFGKIDTINRAFFVPFRVLFKDWKEFISNQKVAHVSNGGTSMSYVPVSPQTTVHFMSYAFVSLCSRGMEPSSGQLGRIYDSSPASYDYVYTEFYNGQTTKKYIVLTYMGRKLMTILHGLGYNFPFITYSSNHDDDENLFEISSTKLSLLPLLAFARAYFDWIIPSRFISAHRNLQCAIGDIFAGFTDVNSTGSYNDGTGVVKAPMLIGLMKLYSSYLADDYFTSAFMTTFGYEDTENVGYATKLSNPNYRDEIDFEGVSSTIDSSDVTNLGKGASTLSTAQYIQQFTIKSLGALQDMINRGKVAGSKIQDYLRVTYGIRPSSEALDLSVYLGSNRSSIQIGSVMSNADTLEQGGASLGQYAGRGIGDNQGHFSYEAKEHGIFIITNELQVKSSYFQGLRPECTLIDREDFFQPEFDNQGVDAIDRRQLLFSDIEGADAVNLSYGQGVDYPFGFTPRYSKLKVNFDSLLGDFRFKSKNTGLDSWYLARYFNGGKDYEIDENFSLMTQRNTSTQYDHIFQVADNSADHFYSIFSLDFTAYRHMKTISEALDTEEGSDKIDVDFNGGVD